MVYATPLVLMRPIPPLLSSFGFFFSLGVIPLLFSSMVLSALNYSIITLY